MDVCLIHPLRCLAWIAVTVMAISTLAWPGSTTATGAPPPLLYLDTRLSFEERAADLVSHMTLPEKAGQLATLNAPAIPRLGVQEYAYGSEAQHGVYTLTGNYYGSGPLLPFAQAPGTSFPTNLAASLSWDPELVRRESDAISDEARGFVDPARFGTAANNLGPQASSYGSLSFWAPTVEMSRDPRWGRVDEAFGEDPLLTGTLGGAWVNGFQGQTRTGEPRDPYLKAIATLKHFALNNVERNRMSISSDTDEATIREYYTAPFGRIVQDAHVGGLMSSYNSVNATPAVTNSFLLNVLARRTWGFGGAVTSDCLGVGTAYRRPDQPFGIPGTLLYVAGHDWAPPGWTTNHGGERYAVWTRHADGMQVSGKAGAEAFSLRAGNDVNCFGENGVFGRPILADLVNLFLPSENDIRYIREAIAAGVLSEDVLDTALIRVFTLRMRTGEFDPREGQRYTKVPGSVVQSDAHSELAQAVAERSLVLLQNEAPAGSTTPLLPADPRELDRVVVLGDQAAKTYLGGYSGKPTESIPLVRGLSDAVKAVNPAASFTYDRAFTWSTSAFPAFLSWQTQQAVRHADLVVIMVGTDELTNAEGNDRRSLALPWSYQSLVAQTAKLGNPRIALVVQSGSPVELGPLKDKVASILYSGPAGQRQGTAFANAIVGNVNPSGRLSFTWYRDTAQLPAMDDYDLAPSATGGLGRTYQYFTGTPEYRFGHGLGYTEFAWSNVHVDRSAFDANDTATVDVTVTNTGGEPGSDVVQVYARSPQVAGREVPVRRLVGFAKTGELAPGASQTLTIRVPIASTLRLWDDAAQRSVVHPGTYAFEVARAAGDIVQEVPVRVSGQISTAIRHVTVQTPKSFLSVGEALDLRGENPWLQGLGPSGTEPRAEDIVAAVRDDDSFVDLADGDLRYSSNRPDVLDVTPAGIVAAKNQGVATITVTAAGRHADAVFAVR